MGTIQQLRNAIAVGVVACTAALTPAAAAVETTEPIRIPVVDTTDADFVAFVYGTILKELGYNVDYVRVDYSAQIAAVETGDVDLSTSLWDTSSWHGIVKAVQGGEVSNYGSTGVEVHEGWWYPSYLTEYCPGLPNWEALNEASCIEALSTAETSPKGRYIDPPADWQTDADRRVEALELDYEVISAGSAIAMVATIQSAVKRKEPILGWGFKPHWFYNGEDGAYIELPADTPECYEDPSWGVNENDTYDCGYGRGYIWKIANVDFAKWAPRAARVLLLLELETDAVAWATGRAENDGVDIEQVAEEWVAANPDIWRSWYR